MAALPVRSPAARLYVDSKSISLAAALRHAACGLQQGSGTTFQLKLNLSGAGWATGALPVTVAAGALAALEPAPARRPAGAHATVRTAYRANLRRLHLSAHH